MAMNCTLKNSQNGKFYFTYILQLKKIESQKKENIII